MDPFLGEIRMFGGNFAPQGWMFCNGQVLPISQYDALYSLIGTTYGGDGQTTFALPNLQSRIPINQFQGPGLSNHTLGEAAGVESVTLSTAQIPAHSHAVMVSGALGHLSEPLAGSPARHRDFPAFGGSSNLSMSSQSLTPAGGSQPHANMPPYLVVSFIIAVEGIYPSRN